MGNEKRFSQSFNRIYCMEKEIIYQHQILSASLALAEPLHQSLFIS